MSIALMFVFGLFLLILGASSFSEHSAALSARFCTALPIVGATVAAAAAALPLLAITLRAAAQSHGEIAAGAALGSVVFNSCFTGGLCALLAPKENCGRGLALRGLLFFLLGVGFLAFSAVRTGELGVGLGIILLSLLAVFLLTAGKGEKTSSAAQERLELICFALLVSAAALYLGSGILVDSSLSLSSELGLEPYAAALVLIAPGTALPVLFTVLISVIKKRGGLAFGLLIGSNILNVILAVGLPAVLSPTAVGDEICRDAAAAAAAVTALSSVPIFKGRLSRPQGVVLLVMYAAYIIMKLLA